MISFLFFCENLPKMESSALVTCFRMSSYFRKDLKNLWCTVPPQVPPSIQSG